MKVLLATTATPDDRKTVAAARSLSQAGASVAVGGDHFLGQAFYTRSLSQRFRYPHPNLGLQPFLETVNQHLARNQCDVVLPMNDYTTVALTQGRDILDRTIATALPSRESLEVAGDKLRTAALAQDLGLQTPATFEVEEPGSLPEIAKRVGFPCVVKLRRGSGAVGFQVIRDKQQLQATCGEPRGPTDLAFDREHLLVQEYVTGQVHDACVLCESGKIRAALTQRRLRAYPSEGGIGTLVETTDEPELLNRAQEILAALDWHGPAQVEFKIDPDTGRTWLLEINGRFWGSLGAAIQAGINFPLLTCKLALGQDLSPPPDYTVGLRYRFPFPFGLLALTEGGPRGQVLRDFFAPQRGTRSDLVWSDPLPPLAESVFIARRAWQRRSLKPVQQRL